MEGMSRDRRPYHALEVDEDQAYSRLLKTRQDSKVHSRRVAEARESLLWFLPGISCLCAENGLAAALDELEEKYFGLEER